SVCRDYLEPSVACFVHAELGLPETCLNFDVVNACLGFLDGMAIVGNMIERGQVQYGLVVDAESSRTVVERTVDRLGAATCDEQARILGFNRSKAFLIYPELGNVGPASIPIALSKALASERLAAGDRVVLGGIGSGLNCTAAGVIW